jgi:plastocyanin
VKTKLLIISISFAAMNISWAGDVKGSITFEGNAPKMKPLRMDADPVCVANNEIKPRKEWLILGKDNGIKNMLVYIKESKSGSLLGTPVTEDVAVLDQNGCVYIPHVLGVMVGQQINILNSDGTLHNIHALPKVNKEFNKAMPRSKKQMTVTFNKSEDPFKIKCDVHPWMGAYVGVFDHPYFAVTDDSGSYTISNLPAGKYVIEAWHEKLGSQTADITVDDSGASQDFSFKKPSKKK